MVCEILHVMSMIHRTVMHLSLANLLYGIVIMESSSAAYHIDNRSCPHEYEDQLMHPDAR